MDAKGKGKEVLSLNSGVFNSAGFESFSNFQDFFESLTSLGDLSALGAFQQSVPSLPEHLAAATAAIGQQGSAANLGSFNLGRSDSFADFTQSSLQNLQLSLTEVEQGVIAWGQVQQPQPSPQPQLSPPFQQQQQQQQPQHAHQSQQAQPLPPVAAATYAPIKPTTAALQPHHHPSLQQPTPIYLSPAQFAAFAPSMHTYPHPQQPQHSTQQWGPRPGAQVLSPKLPLAPSSAAMMAQSGGVGGAPSLAPIGGPPPGGLAVPQEFSSTLYSLASTLPPPMILSNDSVLGSVGGGLHFQRHCVRRRMPDELTQADPSMFLN